MIVALKVITDLKPRSPKREIEDKCNIVEIRYLRNLLLQADRNLTETIKLVLGKLIDSEQKKY